MLTIFIFFTRLRWYTICGSLLYRFSINFFTFDWELLFRKNGRLRAQVRFRLITSPFHHLRQAVMSKRILSRLIYILDFPPSSRISFAEL